jgi:hypothetical protein
MKIKILPGEYLFSEQGLHVLDESGFAKIATEETEVEVNDESQLEVIKAYHDEKRKLPVVEDIVDGGSENTPIDGETQNA